MQSSTWRIRAVAVQGESLELSALHLYSAAGRIDHLATLSCSHAPVSGSLATLQQGDTTGTVRFAREQFGSAGFWLQWEFAAPVEVSALRWGSASGEQQFARFASPECADAGRWLYPGKMSDIAWPGPRAFADVSLTADWSLDTIVYADFQDVLSSMDYVDESGNYWSCSPTGRFGYAQGDRNRSLYLPLGATAASTNRDLLDFGAGDFTLEVWVLPSMTASGAVGSWIISNDSTAGVRAFAMALLPDRSIGINFFVSQGETQGAVSRTGVFDWGTVTHLVAERGGNTFYLFANGKLAGSWAVTGALQRNAGADVTLGSNPGGQSGTYFDGRIFGLRIRKGSCRWTAEFTPPPRPNALRPWPLGWPVATATALPGDPIQAAAAAAPSRAALARDVEYGGVGSIWGTTKTKGRPENLPVLARVVLHHQRSRLPVREVWSDPVTGDFAFRGVDIAQEFFVMAEDAAGQMRAVAAQRLTPEEMP